MNGRTAPVQGIHYESVTVSADFPVMLGEIARSEDGTWLGLVHSQKGNTVRLLPLDRPEKIVAGMRLVFTEQTVGALGDDARFGTVVDAAGRLIAEPAPASSDPVSVPNPDFWGLGNLGDYMKIRRGEGVALLGDPPGGFPALFSQIAEAQHADSLFILCRSGVRELQNYISAVRAAGCLSRTLIIWGAPWHTPALKDIAPYLLERLVARRPAGSALILIDDLRRWLMGIREYGESSDDPFLPDGYPHTARRQFARFLDLKSPPDEAGNSASLIVGWHYEKETAPLLEHPYMARLSRFMRTGLILREHAEYLVPTEDSWGEPAPVGRCWQKLCRIVDAAGDESRPALELLQNLFARVFLEYSPLGTNYGSDDRLPFTQHEESRLLALTDKGPELMDGLLSLRDELQLHFREPPHVRRRILLNYLDSGEVRA